ncbi:hypothetical protein BO86DRAFT_206239 [Aspergillus japonicus CBS 114.51]|uniref:Uncharacterized protein n=1 Tax=Aspergillus japonicus CBS 114.51 TaxID=1448312 RepID=A0A8T8WPW6_ASPJA|nr:hypothetical protein BO86DRAFT_206239 [Aspergillus japonicus CBS 114.51]RAH77680.1 hypothetical protein BO86DRAFT_206239 [Aspergillus japonicus CBS 114.51]
MDFIVSDRIPPISGGQTTHLRVVLDSLHRLLLGLAGTGAELSIQALLLLLLDLPGVGAVVVLRSFRADIQSLVVLLHGNQSLRLAHVRPNELGIPLGSFVTVLHRLGESHQLDESRSAVGEPAGVLGGALGHLGEGVHGSRPVTLLELGLAELAGLLGFSRVDVGLLFSFGLGLLGVAQLRENIGSTVLSQRLVVELDGLAELAKLLVCGTDTCKGPTYNHGR